MDHTGRRVGFQSSLVESERLLRALGAHCPFSHQCLGCEHFRSDPSHLPDLYAYLERLLETRERLRVAVPELAEWARTKAIPADAEIRTVRTLIQAGENALSSSPPAAIPSRHSHRQRSRHCHLCERSQRGPALDERPSGEYDYGLILIGEDRVGPVSPAEAVAQGTAAGPDAFAVLGSLRAARADHPDTR